MITFLNIFEEKIEWRSFERRPGIKFVNLWKFNKVFDKRNDMAHHKYGISVFTNSGIYSTYETNIVLLEWYCKTIIL